MASAKFHPGPTGRTVAENVRRLREAQNLSTHKLAARLRRTGSSMTPTSVQRLEDGQRRIDVDDLMHLCRVFNVVPSTLLFTPSTDADARADVTAHGSPRAMQVWLWSLGELDGLGSWDGDNFEDLNEGYTVRADAAFRADVLPQPVADHMNERDKHIEAQEKLIDSMSDVIEQRMDMAAQTQELASSLEDLGRRLRALEDRA